MQFKINEKQKYREVELDAELGKSILSKIKIKTDSIKNSNVLYAEFVDYIFDDKSKIFYAQQILEEEYKDFSERIRGKEYDGSEFSYFRVYLPYGSWDTNSGARPRTYQDKLNIVDSIYSNAENEAKVFMYEGSSDSLRNIIYQYYRPSIERSNYKVSVYSDETRKWDRSSFSNVPNYVKFLSSNYPISWNNSEEWYKFILDTYKKGVRNNLRLTREDIEGYIAENFVFENGTKFKVRNPKKNSVKPADIFEFVYKKRLALAPDKALTTDSRNYYTASWSLSKSVWHPRQSFLLSEVCQALKNDKKFNKIVDELASICVY